LDVANVNRVADRQPGTPRATAWGTDNVRDPLARLSATALTSGRPHWVESASQVMWSLSVFGSGSAQPVPTQAHSDGRRRQLASRNPGALPACGIQPSAGVMWPLVALGGALPVTLATCGILALDHQPQQCGLPRRQVTSCGTNTTRSRAAVFAQNALVHAERLLRVGATWLPGTVLVVHGRFEFWWSC
jgi:hypothetical protein